MSMGVYRCYDATGDLLYIGFSTDVERRIRSHRCSSHWARQMARYEVEGVATLDEGYRLERHAIVREFPTHNVANNSPDSLAREIDQLYDGLTPDDHAALDAWDRAVIGNLFADWSIPGVTDPRPPEPIPPLTPGAARFNAEARMLEYGIRLRTNVAALLPRPAQWVAA